MLAVWYSQLTKERRYPLLTLSFIGLSVLAVVIFGLGADGRMKVGVFASEGVEAAEVSSWLAQLNENSPFDFETRDEGIIRREVAEGRATAAVMLLPGGYRIVAAVDDYNVDLIENHVRGVFERELALQAAAERAGDPAAFDRRVRELLAGPAFTLETRTPGGGEFVPYDMRLHLMFGFSMFLVLFTIGFKILAINLEKTSGIWNRMILSPTRKTGMYMGHLTYAAGVGFFQMLVVYVIFLFVFDFPIGGRFGELLLVNALYVAAAVAIAMLFSGLTRPPEQFKMIYPTVVPIMPLISGAYMPPGTITNEFLVTLAQLFPLTHAMDAFMGIALYDVGWSELFAPLAKMLLITVVCMGVGINLVERGRN